MLDELENQLQEKFEVHSANRGLEHETLVDGVPARVSLQSNRRGEPTFRYWFGESRVDRLTFRTLSCTEARCPQKQATMEKWLVHVGRAKPKRMERVEPSTQCGLAAEVHMSMGDKAFVAREARFPVMVNCRHHAHAPLRVSVKGWDLFGEGGCLAGGWVGDAPMFETLVQVEQWLQAHVTCGQAVPFAVEF